MYAHYAKDPSFNCFPSLHAAVATITFYAWHRYARLLRSPVVRGIAIGTLAVGIGVVLSTLFVKQHYIADEIAGVLLAWGIGRWMFDAFWGSASRDAGSRGATSGAAPKAPAASK
jgi:membrane-associated phospholipid phosphatase